METLNQGKNMGEQIFTIIVGVQEKENKLHPLHSRVFPLGFKQQAPLRLCLRASSLSRVILLLSHFITLYTSCRYVLFYIHNVCPRYIYTYTQYGIFINIVTITIIGIIITTVTINQPTDRLGVSTN